ncbi:MAG: DNA repair protein RecO [Atopobiaceae bacterium]|nr:DNA repair protein RecO [Atopobiaceae bacterium]
MASARTRRLKAIVLSRTKLAEQDSILTVVSETGEQVQVVAKGARKSGGRLASRCDLFCETDLLVARGRGQLEIVSEASLIEPHTSLRADIERMASASAVCEVVRLMCYEDAHDSFLYPICSRALYACEQADSRAALDTVVAALTFKLLAHGGWWPELQRCVMCDDETPHLFSARLGGLVCEACSRDVEGAEAITPSQLAWMQAFMKMTFDELLASYPDEQTALCLVSMAHVWASTHLDARLRSFEFLMSL